MDELETPYDVEADFIECPVCEKSIRGDTLYKIHLTTAGHIKKEKGLVTLGAAAGNSSVPDFKDILHYLDYVKLSEPIIGLDFLKQVPSVDVQESLRYSCKLCNLTANLTDMVHHVIGRKHRQKYVETKRPDLVTWDKPSAMYQGGKVIRARAEIVERQDGRGTPKPMDKEGNGSKSNTLRVPPRQSQNRNIPQRQKDVQPLFPEIKGNNGQYSDRRYPDMPSFQPDDPYVNKDRQMYQREDSLGCGYMKDDVRGADYRDNTMYSQEFMDPKKDMQYEDEYVEDPQRRDGHEPRGGTRYDPWEESMPYGQNQQFDYFPEEASSYRGPHPERDALKEFFSEEVSRRKARLEYEPSNSAYPEDEHRWSLDRESVRHDAMSRASEQGSSQPEVKGSISIPTENDHPHSHLFDIIKDYRHKKGGLCDEVVSNPGPSRTESTGDVTRTISSIPEPFRRFLMGATNDEGCDQRKRKRKSRFSDATAEEVERTKKIFREECGPPYPKFGGHSRSVSDSVRPEMYGTQHPDLYRQSQSPRPPESYRRGVESEGVFDLLKGIEIENAEEADFLKNKLCILLREFKSRKSERTVQISQGRAVPKNDYNSLKPGPSPLQHYETTAREDSDLRQAQDIRLQDHSRGRGWQQCQEYYHSSHKEPRPSNRNVYEETFGHPGMSRTPDVPYSDEPGHYPERFQEPNHPCGYRPASEKYFDRPSAPLHVVEEPRIQSGSRYSSHLDKITSTLLELVARKQP